MWSNGNREVVFAIYHSGYPIYSDTQHRSWRRIKHFQTYSALILLSNSFA